MASTDLLIQFREIVAPQIAEALDTGYKTDFEEFKRLFYHHKYNRDIKFSNDWFLYFEFPLYFNEVDANIVVPEN